MKFATELFMQLMFSPFILSFTYTTWSDIIITIFNIIQNANSLNFTGNNETPSTFAYYFENKKL